MREWVVDFGGEGTPIVLLHGLMGRATTWWPVAQWLRARGHVYGVDARGHGRNPRGGPYRTETCVDDLAEVVGGLGQSVLVGHSMGGLHALGLAATHPELVRGVVVEDMAVDLREKSVDTWRPLFDGWPDAFESIAHVREFFGSTGDYFAECVTERDGGYRMIADLDDMYAIAAEWADREFWSYVDGARCPVLLLEAEHSLMPPGQMAAMAGRARAGTHVVVPGAGHVVHDDAPDFHRGAVEAFLAQLR